MGHRVGISIENGSLKVVYTKQRGGKTIVEEVFNIQEQGVEDYLRSEKNREFYLNIHFPDLFQDTFVLPPARGKALQLLIERELHAQNPDVSEWLYSYFITGQKLTEAQPQTEVLVFAIPRASVDRYLHIFLGFGKKVEALIPNYLPLLNLIPEVDTPSLFVFRRAEDRAVLLCYRGVLYLLRRLRGSPLWLDDSDIQSINMTVNYSRQRLGLVPEVVYLVGQQEVSEDLSTLPVIPLSSLVTPSVEFSQSLKATDMVEYILPIATTLKRRASLLSPLLRRGVPQEKMFLPGDYRFYRNVNRYLTVSSLLMAVLSAFLVAVLPVKLNELKTVRDSINMLRGEVSDIRQINAVYQREFQKWKGYEEKIQTLQSLMRETSPAEFFIKVSETASGITIDQVKVERQMNSLSFTIKGRVDGEGLLQRQRTLRAFMESLSSTGIKISGETFRLDEGTFIIAGTLEEMR